MFEFQFLNLDDHITAICRSTYFHIINIGKLGIYYCIMLVISKKKCLSSNFLNLDDHITAICRSTYFHITNIEKTRNLLSYNACSTIIHALISCRLDYCNSLLYNVPTHKTTCLQRLQNQCACILTKSPRREYITPVLKSLHWLKIQDRITYKILMLTYKSYYNIAPTYLCELISRRESSVKNLLKTISKYPWIILDDIFPK